MSITDARVFIRARLDSQTLTEHDDIFLDSNIPDDLLDDSYRIEPGAFVTNSIFNQHGYNIRYSTVVNIYKRGFNSPATAIDELISKGNDFIKDFLDPTLRTAAIKQGIFNNMRIVQLTGDEDDQVLKAEIDLDVDVILCPNNI